MSLTIIGEVRNPDTYQAPEGATILELLKLSGGPTSDADLKRAAIIRENNKRIPVDLEMAFQQGEFQSLPPLQANDTLYVPRLQEKPSAWKSVVRTALDVATVVTAFLLIEKRAED
jgi:protein involved in polysaccharide export with SLBB domain